MVASPTIRRLGGEEAPLIVDGLQSREADRRRESRSQTVTETRTSFRRVLDAAQAPSRVEKVLETGEQPIDEIRDAIQLRIAEAVSDDDPKDCHFFSMDALSVIRGMVRELMSKGWVPSIRHSIYDRFGTPLYPLNEIGESEPLAEGGRFIALTRMPRGFIASSFRKPRTPGYVAELANTKQLKFGPEVADTGYIAVAMCNVADKDSVTLESIPKKDGNNWDTPQTIPNINYECPPLEGIKQYGTGLFEGMSVERNQEGEVAVFRLRDHWERMNKGGLKLGMPEIPFELFEKMVQDVIQANWEYIPECGKGRMYLRPNWFDHGGALRVKNSGRFALTISAIPIASAEGYFTKGRKKFFMAKGRARVAEGGASGTLKLDGNYATTIKLIENAEAKGMAGVIFTNSTGARVEETNASSVIFIKVEYGQGAGGEKRIKKIRIITPSLDHGTILKSNTRDAILEDARARGVVDQDPDAKIEWTVEETDVSPDQVRAWAEEARDNPDEKGFEAIAVGTAAVISAIHEIQVGSVDPESLDLSEDGDLIQITQPTANPTEEGRGAASQLIFEALAGFKSGEAQSELREIYKQTPASNANYADLGKRLGVVENYLSIVEAPKDRQRVAA